MSWSVVVPSNRPDRLNQFLESWQPLFAKHNVRPIIVFDGESVPSYETVSPRVHGNEWYCWRDIPDFIPRKTDMIRSWGIYRAWEAGTTYTLSLDDDVLPEGDLFEEYEKVFVGGAPCSDYLDVGALTSFGKQLRGFPFRDRATAEVAVQYGGWNGILDYDAPTQLAGVNPVETFHPVVLPVPRGAAVTGCIMNCAWRTEYAPIMWQLPLDARGQFNRFGDIWAGLFAKKTLDGAGKVMVVNGKASVRHERASDPLANLAREAPGIPVNEDLWKALAPPTVGPEIEAYRQVTDSAHRFFARHDSEYSDHFLAARDEWLGLFA